MIKDKKIFDGWTINLDGIKVRVLATPHHISRSEIPHGLNVYSLIKKKKEDHYMVDDMDTTNTADFAMSIISHVAVPLGSDIELERSDMLYGGGAVMSIKEYFIETVGDIKLYVMMPTEDVASEEIIKILNAAHRCFAIAYGRSIDDVEVLNQEVSENKLAEVTPMFESDVDKSIYHLTNKLRIMGKATHILDMSRQHGIFRENPCCVEREVCEKYNLKRINVGLINEVVKKLRKDNDDLNIIMGKSEVIGTPAIPYFPNVPTPYRTPGLGGYGYIGDPTLGFPL